MSLYLGSDHRGYPLKEGIKKYLTEKKIPYTDLGCFSEKSVDYPDFAQKVCRKVVEDPEKNRGILVCKTGIGMSIAANRNPKVRAALCFNKLMVRLARQHNNANILCLGEKIVSRKLAEEIVKIFLKTKFEGGRHERRVKKLS